MRIVLPHPALVVLVLFIAFALGRTIGETIAGPTPMAPQPPPVDGHGHYQLWTEVEE